MTGEAPEAWMQAWRRLGVWQEGHFLLTSGRHSPVFLQFSRLTQWPRELAPVAEALVAPVRSLRPEAVVGPAMGGVVLAYEAARALGVRALYTEKDGRGGMVLRRGFAVGEGEPLLVVEDALTTGGSVRACLEAVRTHGGRVLAVAVLVDRSGGQVDLGVPLYPLVSVSLPTYTPDTCPLCRAGVPLTQPKAEAGR